MAGVTQPFGQKLAAGDRWKWTLTLADYPADVWQITYSFRGASEIDIPSTASGTDHLLSALPADTGKLLPGSYAWQLTVQKLADATEHYELGRGTVEILANIQKAGAGATDFRSWAQRSLDNIRKVLEGTATREESEYQIGGRMLKVRSVDELFELEAKFAARVKKEQVENGTASPNSNMVHVRFGSAS
jgi:hypothetical protein